MEFKLKFTTFQFTLNLFTSMKSCLVPKDFMRCLSLPIYFDLSCESIRELLKALKEIIDLKDKLIHRHAIFL